MNPEKPSNGGTAVPADQPISVLSPPGLVSILIPCCGQLEYTKLCIPALLQHTRKPFELIFLDIGSLDGTSEYLAGLQAAGNHLGLRIEILRTQTDLGIGDVVRDALQEARGEYLLLLNNDTIVTEHWLNQMISLASTSPTIGLVGPMSNYAAPPQLVETVSYRIGPRRHLLGQASSAVGNWLVDVSAVDQFAKEFREENRGKWLECERLGGFCLLVKRAVLKKIEQTTSLRQWTDLALFDTDILSNKARQAGFTLACCRDLYVHHFGSRIFAGGAPKVDWVDGKGK